MRTAAPIGELGGTLLAALRAGLTLGLGFGLADGVVAALRTPAALGPLELGLCLAASIAQYALLAVGALALSALVGHAALSRWSRLARLQAFLALGISAGLLGELAWWTRPLVLYGRPWNHPGRIAWTLVCLALAVLAARVLARPLARSVERLGARLALPIGALALAGGTWILSQQHVLDGQGEPNERTRAMPNVLLVVVDALRADTLGCYGDARVVSPHVDRLAREGVLFEHATAQTPFTWPAFGSFLTGKYPRRHGLVRMAPGTRMVPNVTLASHLERARTRSGTGPGTQLADADVLSATFHTGTLSTGSGLLQGFDLYFEQMAGRGLTVAESSWSVFRSDLLFEILRAKLAQKTGADVAGAARAWLAHNAGRRFFAMVHLYSTHTPYDPPEEFRRHYVDPAYQGPVRAFYAQHREAIERGEAAPTPADVRQIRDLYLAGVTQADAAIGALLAELERAGTLDQTLVIVTSDHGESLGEQGLWEHNHMVQTNLRIPLVMRLPGALPAGARIGALVEQVDLFPTVCSLLGLELPEQPDVHSRIDGHDLVPLVRGEVASVREHAFSENASFFAVQDQRWKLVVPTELLDEEPWSRGVDAHGSRAVLYDLKADPGEETSVLEAQRDQAERLVAVLRAWSRALPIARMERSARDLESVELFQRLGYAGGVGARPPAPSQPPGQR
jgi:arylsulfatase A-like enzyme